MRFGVSTPTPYPKAEHLDAAFNSFAFNDRVESAIDAQSGTIARSLVVKITGIDLTKLSPDERRIAQRRLPGYNDIAPHS